MKESAVTLARVSDEKQSDGYSLPAQEKDGLRYCEAQGFEIIQRFEFVESASKHGEAAHFD